MRVIRPLPSGAPGDGGFAFSCSISTASGRTRPTDFSRGCSTGNCPKA